MKLNCWLITQIVLLVAVGWLWLGSRTLTARVVELEKGPDSIVYDYRSYKYIYTGEGPPPWEVWDE